MKKIIFSILLTAFICKGYSQEWTWMHGPTLINTFGFYGTLGVSSPTVIPGSRHAAGNWVDLAGNLWLFGGEGLGQSGTSGWLNDLWKYNITTSQWTWMKGDSVKNKNGVYGTQGVSSPLNNPGSREFCISWTDASGNFWMMGGDGYGATGPLGNLGDLWKYNPTTNEWTWMKGPTAINQNGTYGTMGVSSPANLPGCRHSSSKWIDASGKLWLFGGWGFPAVGSNAQLNDLWKYNPTNNEWTWVAGTNLTMQFGNYGTKGVFSPTNYPGSREFSTSWLDKNGNFWVFGGAGYAAAGAPGYMNDLWKYNPLTNQWAWMNGTNLVSQNGIYGSLGVSSSTVTPGAKYCPRSWTDATGNLYLFGGLGFAAVGGLGYMNDVFKYNPVINEWTWVKGPNFSGQYGSYGTLQIPAPTNHPGGRNYTTYWTDLSNNFWLWGGFGFPVVGAPGNMNELWKFVPACAPNNNTPSGNLYVCSGNSVSLFASGTGTNTLSWYATAVSTVVIGTGTLFATPVLTASPNTTVYPYYVEDPSCATRKLINVTVYALPSLTVTTSNTMICIAETATLNVSGANTYTWSTGSNNTTITASPTITTNYTVTGTNADGCLGTSVLTQSVSACTGIAFLNNSSFQINIYPNPIGEVVSFELVSLEFENLEVRIKNLLGEEIKTEKIYLSQQSINVSEIRSGIYFLEFILNDKNLVTKKIIKQ